MQQSNALNGSVLGMVHFIVALHASPEAFTSKSQINLAHECVLPPTRIQHDGSWSRHMGNNTPPRAVHRHGADALVNIVTEINPSVYPVKSNAIRSAKICQNTQGTKNIICLHP